ncbi:uncharacterized protein LOC129592506 [Paramacrobiotus metropolitanus]|uniref:uncharacterized protein LOC129592506 n=1 Tax=Paramacrobiotus metropolitanus TaxID=2943436 RepID=UPI002445F9C8|nr:uncharacterized protein LOC129592506 [Paramacrobiotus metropolitanus]
MNMDHGTNRTNATDSWIFPDIPTSGIRIIYLEQWEPWASQSHGGVHKALRTDTGEIIVVKTVDVDGRGDMSWKEDNETRNGLLDTLKSHFEFIKHLRHPNIVHHLHYQEQMKGEQRLYGFEIFMELFGRSTLHNMACSVELTSVQIQHIMRQVVDGLAYLHEHHCAHRDLRGCNILVAPTGTNEYKVKLAGLGNIKDATGKWAYRRDYRYIRFFAPERLLFDRSPPRYQPPGAASRRNKRLDVWSLGCVVLEVVNRGWPEYFKTDYQGQRVKLEMDNVVGLLCVVIEQEGSPEISDALPEAVRSFIEKCLVREPRNRPKVEDLKGHEFLTAPEDVVGNWILPPRTVSRDDFVY